MSSCLISVVVPAHNEAATITSLVEKLHEILREAGAFEIIIVDDGSSDATRQILDHLSRPVRVIRNQENRGKGHALRRGIAQARGEVIAYIDADESISPRFLLPMLERIRQGCDIVIASRHFGEVSGSDTDSRFRAVASRLFVKFRSVILRDLGCRDTQCGLKVFTKEVKNDIVARCRIDGFGFDCEFLFLASRRNCQIEEFPVKVTMTGKNKRYAYWLRQGGIIIGELLRIRLNWWLKGYRDQTGQSDPERG